MSKKYFEITSISRDDLAARGFDVENVSDAQMERLAQDMKGVYLDTLYWPCLIQKAEEMGIPRSETPVEQGESGSQEYSREQIEQILVNKIYDIIDYWNTLPNKTQKERMEGLAFSILSTLDGSSIELPAFIVAPCPHPDDKEYHIERGENYFPDNDNLVDLIKGDLGGVLHEIFYSKRPGK